MNDENRQARLRDWLWDSLRAEQADPAAAPDDRTLRVYRARKLTQAKATQLEWQLCRSRPGRFRLAELAGVGSLGPSEQVRARVLGLEVPRPRAGRFTLFAVAAIAATLLLAFWLGGPAPTPRALPAGLEFDVRVLGLAEVRGAEASGQAFADTPVRILVEPKDQAVDGLEFRLYGRTDGSLVRLDDGIAVAIRSHRGAAEIVARSAADLGGAEPGMRDLYLVISLETEIPRVIELAGNQDAEKILETLSSGQVYRRTLEIVPAQEKNE